MTLAAFPLLLEPYCHWCETLGEMGNRAAYHMEAPTWSNGLVNLLACAGFSTFGKSMLNYQAPWVTPLMELPGVVRLQAAPGRHVYLLLPGRGDRRCAETPD